eukprot:434670_1
MATISISSLQKLQTQHQFKRDKLNDQMNQNTKLKSTPLHEFSNIDICNTIKWWIYNDINYNKNLSRTMDILSQSSLSGKLITQLAFKALKSMIQTDCLTFMTHQTLNIILEHLKSWISQNKEEVKQKTAEEIGYILFNYPLNSLINKINGASGDNNIINGKQYILYYKQNKKWIQEATGWAEEEIYQIDSQLFKQYTYTTAQIIRNIENIKLTDAFGQSLSDTVKNRIISHCNVEYLHCKIKNNNNIQDFSDMIMNMVDEIIIQRNDSINDDFVKK